MRNFSFKLVFLAAVTLDIIIRKGSTLECYQCAETDNCRDPFTIEAPLKTCSNGETACGKVILMGRVHRGCTTENFCDQSEVHVARPQHCSTCSTSLCNSVSPKAAFLPLIALLYLTSKLMV